ncbi:biotin transport system substrate-specific component [Kutzneria viridogrisea]|uniref:Biotin transporter n=1 Tax=Kutzneria viridogrisea TaxID=47990 RepID=A0ABR6BNP9_9PSEU|nr:biotin transporter BioY [Kutzneria albida]MBA8928519.1 biotin transport system substrate-specific component [Kutzneria viridogrisea]
MRTKDLAHVALFAAIMVVLGLFPLIELPLVPAPVTAQTLGVMLAGSIVGARRGSLAILVFVVMVAVGLPVLPGGRGGLGVILGPTGGFILAYPVGALVVGLLTERLWRRYNLGWALLCNAVGGALVIYLIGIPYMAVAAGLPLDKAVLGSVVFLPGDLVKTVIGSLAAVAVRKSYPMIEVPRDRA